MGNKLADAKRNAERQAYEQQRKQSQDPNNQPFFKHYKFMNLDTPEKQKRFVNYTALFLIGMVFIKCAFGGKGEVQH